MEGVGVMKGLLARWGRQVVRFRWMIVAVWFVLLIIGGLFASQLGTLLTGGGWGVPGSGSDRAYELMATEFEGRSATSLTFVMNHDSHEIGSAEYTAALQEVTGFLIMEEEVERVHTWLDASVEMRKAFIGKDGRTSIGFVELNVDEGFAQKILLSMQERLSSLMEEQRFTVIIVGAPAFWAELGELSQQGLNNAHLYAIPLILIILLLVFRSVVSALTPLVLAIFSIVIALGMLYFIAQQSELSVFVLDAAMMLGIGIGIDFSLIYVMRFKEELRKGGADIATALVTTMRTAGHAIVFSSMTVMCSMCAILFVDIAAVRSIALGIIVVVFLLMLTSLSLLPAILATLGEKINALSLRLLSKKNKARTEGTWYRLAHSVMRRPVLYVCGSALFLMVIAWPALQLEVGTPDSRMLPEDTYVRQGTALLQEGFGVGFASPIHVLVQSRDAKLTSEAQLSQIQQLQDEIQALNHVVETTSLLSYFPKMHLDTVTELLVEHRDQIPQDIQLMIKRSLSKEDDVIVIDVITDDFSASETNHHLVEQIRNMATSFEAGHDFSIVVGGETAEGIDTSKSLNDSLFTVTILTLVFIFVVLIVTFKSIVLPLKAILLNVLSLGATYGVLVAVFQWGWGAKLFDFGDFGFMQSFVPILLLGLLFSLSTDYEVFLLSRVQEEYNDGHTNEESVSLGLEKTAPMISGAALIMVAVFGSFAFAGVLPMQQLGLGMAVAVALDATIVRLILVPASMKLLGKWNWWLPFRTSKVTRHVKVSN